MALKFFGIPPDLRLKIYRPLLVIDEEISVYTKVSASSQLLGMCKLVRSKAAPILYGENTFNGR
jgi:hypothetical protein